MSREFICQSFCFGYKNRRWKVGEKITVGDDEKLSAHFLKHFVSVGDFVQPDLDVMGGPRNDGVLKKLVKVTDTGMSPDTRAMLNGEAVQFIGEPIDESDLVAANVPDPIKRGRRIGSKNK
jgi:hypothetical protein